MTTKKRTRAKTSKPFPDVPPWMKDSWAAADAKDPKQYTMRDVDAVISEVRVEHNPEDYTPVKLTVSVTKGEAAFLKRQAAEFNCSIEELIMNAVAAYRSDERSIGEDREYFTKAISESTEDFKTGRYEGPVD